LLPKLPCCCLPNARNSSLTIEQVRLIVLKRIIRRLVLRQRVLVRVLVVRRCKPLRILIEPLSCASREKSAARGSGVLQRRFALLKLELIPGSLCSLRRCWRRELPCPRSKGSVISGLKLLPKLPDFLLSGLKKWFFVRLLRVPFLLLES
jgi:hypothetical protein